MSWGTEWPAKHDLSSLRLLGSVGEPINPEAWIWYHLHIGGERCPVVDTWWQTETGAIMITPLPGHHDAPSPARRRSRFPASAPRSCTDEGRARSRSAAACWRSPGRGRRCCAASTAIPSATCSRYWSRWTQRHLLHRRRRQARRRRLLLAARPRRRRAERRRASHRHDGGRERAGRSSEGRRSGGGRTRRTRSRARRSPRS